MRRVLWSINGAAFFLTTLAGVGAAFFLHSTTSVAQNRRDERVITGKRIPQPSFQLEVLVDGRPLTEYRERGRTYVEAIRDAEYELRLRNSSPDRVAVALSVDGLNTIDARRTSAWNASKWVIEPYQTIVITGWQMSSERARRFYFTTERDSYVAKLGVADNPGVISAVFYKERRYVAPITGPAPLSSGKSQSRAEMARDSNAATGIGRSVRNEVEWIDMELDPRPVAEATVRYEWGRYESRRFSPEP